MDATFCSLHTLFSPEQTQLHIKRQDCSNYLSLITTVHTQYPPFSALQNLFKILTAMGNPNSIL